MGHFWRNDGRSMKQNAWQWRQRFQSRRGFWAEVACNGLVALIYPRVSASSTLSSPPTIPHPPFPLLKAHP